MEIVTQNELVSINGTLLVQLASFLIFLFVIRKVMFQPLRQIMEVRSTYLKQVQRDITAQEKQLADLISQLKAEETALKGEAFRESGQREDSGKQEARSILRQVRDEIRKQQQQAAADVRVRVEAARQQLASEVEPLVVTILEKVLERRLRP